MLQNPNPVVLQKVKEDFLMTILEVTLHLQILLIIKTKESHLKEIEKRINLTKVY